jgi:hypothetical protein
MLPLSILGWVFFLKGPRSCTAAQNPGLNLNRPRYKHSFAHHIDDFRLGNRASLNRSLLLFVRADDFRLANLGSLNQKLSFSPESEAESRHV